MPQGGSRARPGSLVLRHEIWRYGHIRAAVANAYLAHVGMDVLIRALATWIFLRQKAASLGSLGGDSARRPKSARLDILVLVEIVPGTMPIC
jgi:hypothetical protein